MIAEGSAASNDATSWLPQGIARLEAEFGAQGDLISRELRDPRMKKVYDRVLGPSYKISSQSLALLPPRYRCRDETGLNEKNRAAVALYLIASGAALDIGRFSSRDAEDNINFYDRLIRTGETMKFFRFSDDFEARLKPLHPRHNSDVATALDLCAFFFRQFRDAYENIGGVRWDHQERGQEKGAGKKDYEKFSGVEVPALVRAQLSQMIDETDRIFTPPLLQPLATVASVVLHREVKVKTISNCRGSLRRHGTPKARSKI